MRFASRICSMSQEFKWRYGPGIWEDTEGALHFSLPDILSHFGLEDTPENEAWLQEQMVALVRKNAIPEMSVLVGENCPHCGGRLAAHREGCPVK
jgi:hypothetical protein